MKTVHVKRVDRPTGPWLTDDDLRSDIAISIGCPALHGDKLRWVNVRFTCNQLREYQKRHGGSLVIHKDLVEDLRETYLLMIEQSGKKPQSVPHMDYPFMRFMPIVNGTHRVLHDPVLGVREIPGPVRFLTFFAVSRVV